jgi:hypothetical protein
VNDGADLRQIIRALPHAVQETVRLAATRRRHLADPGTPARLVEKKEIGERSADIDADDDPARHAAPLANRVT